MFGFMLFLIVVVLGAVVYENMRQPNPETRVFPDSREPITQAVTWSHCHTVLETSLYWLLVAMIWPLVAGTIFGWVSLTWYSSYVVQHIADGGIWNMFSFAVTSNILVRCILIYCIGSIALTGYLVVNWPHGVARFLVGRKWRVMNSGLHFVLGGIVIGYRTVVVDEAKKITRRERRYLFGRIGRNVLVLRDELRASVVLTEGGQTSEQAIKTLTTEPLPTSMSVNGNAAAAAASGSGGTTLKFPHNFYFVKWWLFTYLGTSPATLSKHLVTSVDDLFQADWRRFVAILDYDQARFVQGNVFCFADQNDLGRKMEEFRVQHIGPVEAWAAYQRYLANRDEVTEGPRFDIAAFDNLKATRNYVAMARMIREQAPNSLACRVLNQFGVILTFFGIENGIEEAGIAAEREQLKQNQVKQQADFLAGGAEMRRAMGTVLQQHGISLAVWESLPVGDPLRARLHSEMMETWRFTQTMATIGDKDKIILGGSGQSGLSTTIAAMAAVLPQASGGAAAATTTSTSTPPVTPAPPTRSTGRGNRPRRRGNRSRP
ncbi:MAG: hypothetical protein V1846_02400 [Candidatus Komeilibacteria bacterium]